MKNPILGKFKKNVYLSLTSVTFVLAFSIGLFAADATLADVFGFSGRGTITAVDIPTNLYPDIQVGEPFWFELLFDDATTIVDEHPASFFGKYHDVDIVRGTLSYGKRSNTIWEAGSTLDSTSVFFGLHPTQSTNYVVDKFKLSDTGLDPLPTEIVSPFLNFSFTAKRDENEQSFIASDDWFESVKHFSDSWLIGDNFAEVTISGEVNTGTHPLERMRINGEITDVVTIPEPTGLALLILAMSALIILRPAQFVRCVKR